MLVSVLSRIERKFSTSLHVRGRLVVLASIVLALSLWAAGGVVLYEMRIEKWEEARKDNGSLVRAMQNDIAKNIELYDLSLQAAADNLRHSREHR